MTNERLYDYSKGLNAPYWIQEIKTKKGSSPLVLCDTNAIILFHCLYLRFCSDVALWRIHPGSSRKIHTLYFTTALLVPPL